MIQFHGVLLSNVVSTAMNIRPIAIFSKQGLKVISNQMFELRAPGSCGALCYRQRDGGLEGRSPPEEGECPPEEPGYVCQAGQEGLREGSGLE